MLKSKTALMAALIGAAFLGAFQIGSAKAAPFVQSQSQIAEVVQAGENVKEIRWKKRKFRRFIRHNARHWRWCHHHPRRCYGGRPWRHGGHRHRLCHRHLYKVPGMAFHKRVRCDHRHFRAYHSWVWVY